MTKKINSTNGKIRLLAVTLLLTIFLVGFISAFAVGSPYWKGKPLQISPGDTKIVIMTLQNLGEEEDVIVRITLKEGSEIASVEEKDYVVKAGTRDNEVPITVSIPSDVSLDTSYIVTISFRAITSGGGGAVGLSTGTDTTFDVLVTSTEKEEEELQGSNLVWIIISAIVIVLAIIIFVIISRKNSKR